MHGNPSAGVLHSPIGRALGQWQGDERRDGQRPRAGGRLAELRQIDGYAIADDAPDIRGWEVKTAASLGDRTVGCVEDLLVELQTLRVRYILVALDRDVVMTCNQRILVPIGIARLDQDADHVRVDGYTIAHLAVVPRLRPRKLTRRYEELVRRRFALPGPRAGPLRRRVGDFYEQDEFDDRAFWGARRGSHAQRPYLTQCVRSPQS